MWQGQEKTKGLNLNDHQLHIDCYAEKLIYKANGNHISESTNKYAKNKEKEIQIYH